MPKCLEATDLTPALLGQTGYVFLTKQDISHVNCGTITGIAQYLRNGPDVLIEYAKDREIKRDWVDASLVSLSPSF